MNHRTYWKRRRPGEIPRARVSRRSRWLSPLAPALLALAALAAACGGSSGGGEGVASAGGTGGGRNAADSAAGKDPHQAALEFARCMREHGVDMPDPQEGEGGMVMIGPGPAGGEPSRGQQPPAGFEEAHQACAHLLKDMVQDGDAKPDPEQQDRALRFAKCMRDNGVNMPDPEFSGNGGGFSIKVGEEGIDPGSAAFKEAQKVCGSLFGPGHGEPGIGIAGRTGS
jgi:hypothetical protein